MNKPAFIRLDAAEATKLIAREPALRLLDARDEDAFKRGHIGEATRLHGRNLDAVISGTSRQQPVLIYCYHGNASQQYARMFADFGFQRVYDLIGGYLAWQEHLARQKPPPALSPALDTWLVAQGFPRGGIEVTIANATTPLMQAARCGEVGIARELIAAGATLDALNRDGNNALWLACFNGNPETIDLLIEAGMDLDHQNDNGATCLMYAASAGKSEVVARLLAAGADTAPQSLDDFTALDMAANLECLRLLRAATPRAAKAEAA
jgi:thiosulfate/3-mercaptopyruvate sulfurtransferase